MCLTPYHIHEDTLIMELGPAVPIDMLKMHQYHDSCCRLLKPADGPPEWKREPWNINLVIDVRKQINMKEVVNEAPTPTA